MRYGKPMFNSTARALPFEPEHPRTHTRLVGIRGNCRRLSEPGSSLVRCWLPRQLNLEVVVK